MSRRFFFKRSGVLQVTAASLLLSLTGYSATPAAAASGRAQVTMPCHMTYDEGPESDGETLDFGVAMDLQVPNSVRPGDVVSPRGTLTIQAPENLRKRMEGFLDSFEGYSDTMSVGLTINGSRRVFFADRWQTGQQPAGNPLVAKAPITFPAFKVPANASGRIVIDLPRNNVVNNPYTKDGPRRVAATAKVVGRNNAAGDYAYSMACWRADRSRGTVVSIPIAGGTAGNAARGGNRQDSNQGGGPNRGTDGGAGPTRGTGPGGGADDPSLAADPFADGNVANADPAVVAGSGGGTAPMGYGMGPSAQGVFVPTWLMVLTGIGGAMAAAMYSAWLHMRLRALRKATDR